LPEAFDIFPADLAFELPVADGFADDLAGRGVFAGLNRGLEGRELLACQALTF
jgi:hypothetical protein